MSCFSHQGQFWEVVVEEEGHGILPTVVCYAMRVVPRKNKSNNTRGFQNIQGKKSKITIVPLLHKL